MIRLVVTIIVNNCCRKGHGRKSLTAAQAQRLLLRKRGITPGPRQVNPYSCIESFFPTGDPVKDMLTLKNTMYNAQLRGNTNDVPPPKVEETKVSQGEEESKISPRDNDDG